MYKINVKVFIISQFSWVKSLAWLSRILCFRASQAAVWVLATYGSTGEWPASKVTWLLAPFSACACGTEGFCQLLAQASLSCRAGLPGWPLVSSMSAEERVASKYFVSQSSVITYTNHVHSVTWPRAIWLEVNHTQGQGIAQGHEHKQAGAMGPPERLSATCAVQWLGRGDGTDKKGKRPQPVGLPEIISIVTKSLSIFLLIPLILGNWSRLPTESFRLIISGLLHDWGKNLLVSILTRCPKGNW